MVDSRVVKNKGANHKMAFTIKKATGDFEEFDIEKFKRSLLRPGASAELANKIAEEALKKLQQFKTTEDLYRYALDQLKEENPHIAIRYNLKKALLEFGPTGYPFEKYVAEILKELNYQVLINQIVSGWCVDHEIDIIAKKENLNFMVECKFHNQQNYRTDVQVTLYTEARFHDIQKNWTPDKPGEKLDHTWVVTNTKFTYEAIKYGNCIGMKLTSWNYPKEENLAIIIDRLNLYPVTALVSLNKRQKMFFIDHGFVLCRDVGKHEDLLKKAGLNTHEAKKLVNACELACKLRHR